MSVMQLFHPSNPTFPLEPLSSLGRVVKSPRRVALRLLRTLWTVFTCFVFLSWIRSLQGEDQGANECSWLPDTSNMLLVMKTGASESYARIPTQLTTTMKCLPDYLVFSDLEEQINGVKIHDSLEEVDDDLISNDHDFDLYKEQRDCDVDQASCLQRMGSDGDNAAWRLDKFKFIHMIEKTYMMRPHYDWYVFAEADTYVLWSNMAQWLRTSGMDPNGTHYLGSQAVIEELPFGHGGSGYVLSQGTMREFIGNNPGVSHHWDMHISQRGVECGDWVLAKALNETSGIGLQNVWPTINGEKPYTLPFGPSQWCHPVATMHHMNAQEISNFYDFEMRFYRNRTKETQRPLLMQDVFNEFVAPKLVERRDDWDNLGEYTNDDVFYISSSSKMHDLNWLQRMHVRTEGLTLLEHNSAKSFADCRSMCEHTYDCFQFRYRNGICGYRKSFSLGRPKTRETVENARWISGWNIDRIHSWIEDHERCEDPIWSVPDRPEKEAKPKELKL